MTPILSREQIRRYDQHAIDRCGVPSLVLMENAGGGAADVIAGLCPEHVAIVCGRGNNGGDGFVVARHLSARGLSAEVLVVGAQSKMRGDAKANAEAFVGLGGRVTFMEDGLEPLGDALGRADVAVDALFGTGLDREVEGRYREVIAALNEAGAAVVALDIPSGIDADTGAVLGVAVRASHTVTFAHRKSGLVQGEGALHAGTIHVAPLGIPDGPVLEAVGHTAEIIEAEAVGASLGARAPDTHKYRAGSVVVVAGSVGKIGAAWMAGLGALRAGAGLLTLATWSDAADRLEGRLPEAMTLRIDQGDLEDVLAKCKAVAVGPGLGLDARARKLVETLSRSFDGTTVLDADATTLLAGRPEILREASGPRVLTPHAGELARLTDTTSKAVEAHRFEAAQSAAERAGAVVVLKGWRTVVASAERLAVCELGSPAMATGGAGDVLTGMIAALACAAPAFEAACAGVYLHAAAGERWAADRGADRGLLAHELAEWVPALMGALTPD